jgi:6-phosphogluconolactonase
MKRLWTRREVAAATASVAMQAIIRPSLAATSERWVYAGCYTTGTESGGIYGSKWDAAKGELTTLHLAAATDDPSFLIRTRVGGSERIYACNENAKGHVTAFSRQPDGQLKELGRVESGGASPVHLAVDKTGRTLLVVNYDSGSLTAFRLRADGSIGERGSHFQYEGHGKTERQNGPHTHGVVISPDNRYVLVNDLGLDRIFIYRMDAATATLTPSDPPYFASVEGAGPGHTVFHPNGQWAYAVNELNSTLTQMTWDAGQGRLAAASSIAMLPEGAAINDNRAGELAVSADGRFVLATNRGKIEEIVVYRVDVASGALTLVQRLSTGEYEARHFCLDPSGRWVLLSNQKTNLVMVLARDLRSGKLTIEEQRYPLEQVTCTLFA